MTLSIGRNIEGSRMRNSIKKLVLTATLSFATSTFLSVLAIIIFGVVTRVISISTNVEFFPDSVYMAVILIIISEVFIFIYIFLKTYNKLRYDIKYEKKERMIFYIISAFTVLIGTNLSTMICIYIDVVTHILPFYHEMGRTPGEFFWGISALTVVFVSMIVLLSRHSIKRENSHA